MQRIHPTTEQLAAQFMQGVQPPPPGDESEDDYFLTLLHNAQQAAKTDPSVSELLGIVQLLAGPSHDQIYSWMDRQRDARRVKLRSDNEQKQAT